jgi:hypothetical protein
MRQPLTLAAVFLLLGSLTGCGDTPEVLIHDLLVFYNEVCDNQLRCTDEESAKEFIEGGRHKMLKERFDSIKERIKNRTQGIEKDKEMQLDLKNALLDYYDETVATHKRMQNAWKRLNVVCDGISNEDNKKNLIKVRDMIANGFLLTGSGGGGKGTDITGGVEPAGGKWGTGLLPELPKPKQPAGGGGPQGRLILPPWLAPTAVAAAVVPDGRGLAGPGGALG